MEAERAVHGGFTRVTQPGLSGFLDDLGPRTKRRAEPRLGITLAGVGMSMVLIGILTWAGDRLAESDDNGGSSSSGRALGIILSLAVIIAGYAFLLRFERGPLATAGVVASALGVPVLLGFVTYDVARETIESSSDFDSGVDFALPFQIDAIALLSLAVWLVTYARVPAARGRLFYLAASTFTLWLYALEKVEKGSIGYLATLPFFWFIYPVMTGFGEEPKLPDPGTVGGLSFLFGGAFYAVALLLDMCGHKGTATPFTAAGLFVMAVAIGHLAVDLELTGTGILLVAVGSALAFYGAVNDRRITTWAWSAGAGLGVLLIVGDIFDDSAAGFGITAILLGLSVVAVGYLVSARYSEPDEMEPGPSSFTSPTPAGPLPPAGWAPYPPQQTPQSDASF